MRGVYQRGERDKSGVPILCAAAGRRSNCAYRRPALIEVVDRVEHKRLLFKRLRCR